MKKLIIAQGLITALAVAVFGTTGGIPVSFAGTWTLDKAKSQGLDQRMQNAESVTCVITQDDNTISVEWKVEGGQPQGGPGGGGGMGGGRGPAGPRTYNPDGKVLTVVRHSETPRGVQDSTLVFNKQ